MFRNFKLNFILFVFAIGIILTSADIKILIPAGIILDNSSLCQEHVSLGNDQHLLVRKPFNDFEIPLDNRNDLTLMGKTFQKPVQLTESTLKTLAG